MGKGLDTFERRTVLKKYIGNICKMSKNVSNFGSLQK